MLRRLDFIVPDACEEPLYGLGERFGLQVFSSPGIADAEGGEENFRFTGKTTVSILISTIEQDAAAIEQAFHDYLREENLPFDFSRFEYADNEDWMQNFRSVFVPIRIGKKILIRPPWAEPDPKDHPEITILIDPGMAFGTGTHETTRLCLKCLADLEALGHYVLDIGAGSGILSLYLLKRGSHIVEAVEIDGPAVENLRKNAALNGSPGGLKVHCCDLQNFRPRQKADGIVANITSPVLIDSFPRFFRWLKDGAWAIFSGINSTNAPLVKKALATQGFSKIRQKREGEWFAFAAKKVG